MSTTTRFGQHILLKKLAEDPLGETYRAGRLEGTTIGDVVLLRVFGHPGLDTARLTQAFAEGAQHRGAASGLGVSWALELGEVGGLPYAAYEYLPGRDLASLQKALAGGYEPLSEDHAVLLLERVAKGLALLHAAAPGMPAHGFVVPQLIWVSNEGEAKLLGFEAGPQLAVMAVAGQLSAELTAHLSPEVLHGAAPTDRDDVYSLGAILWQLLFGAPPSTAAGPFDIQLHQATLAASGSEVPPGLARLLQRSLAPAAERIQSLDQWHRELIGWMAEAPVSATTFDLAFFLHELFRDEIRREAREIEKEKSLDLRPSPAPLRPAVPEPTLDPVRHTVPLDTRGLEAERAAAAEVEELDTVAAGSSKTGRIAVVVAVLVAIGAGVGWFLLRPAPKPDVAALVAETATAAPQPPALDLEATAAALDQLMRERQQQMEERLRQEYDSQIAALQQQLSEAETAPTGTGAAPAASSAASPSPSAPPPPAQSTPPPNVATSEPPPQHPPASEPPPPSVVPPPTEPAAVPAAEPTRTATVPPPSSPPPPAAAAQAPAPSAPKIQAPSLLRKPDPGYPARARAIKREAIVTVKVLVGRDGRVVQAQPVSPQPKDLGFEDAALKAALKAEYQPARRDGEPIEMWTTLVFNFKL